MTAVGIRGGDSAGNANRNVEDVVVRVVQEVVVQTALSVKARANRTFWASCFRLFGVGNVGFCSRASGVPCWTTVGCDPDAGRASAVPMAVGGRNDCTSWMGSVS